MNRLLDWLNERTDYRRLVREALYERVPGGARWRYVWGSTLVFTFVLQVITGLMLWTAYSPSAQSAWESVYYIQNEMTLGWLVRGIHHFTAQAMVVLMVLHVMQVVVDGAYKAPREVNFWLGLILMQIVLGLALTGYLLPWDQKGYYATRVATNIARATPVVGQQVQELAQGGTEYGHHTLTRFFALHAGILPAALVVFLVLHLAAFRRHGVTAANPDHKPDVAFWPDQVLKDAVACLAVLATILFFAYWKGAELNPPADPSEAFSAARPEWYFLFLFRFLKFEWVEHFGLAFGAIYVPGALMLVLALMPVIAYKKWGHWFNVTFMFVVIAASLFLTGLAMYEDAEDTEHQLALLNAERDAHRVVELAEGPDRIPVDGAISLLRKDPFAQGPRLFAKHCASCHRWDGHDGRGKIVYETSPAVVELQALLADLADEEGADAKKIEAEIKELEAQGKGKVAAYPTATDLANFGDRDWMKSIVLDYGEHFSPLQRTAWSNEYESLAAAARKSIEAGEENAAVAEAMHRATLSAKLNLESARFSLAELHYERLLARREALQADGERGLDVGDELAKLAERIKAGNERLAEVGEAIAELGEQAKSREPPADDLDTLLGEYAATVLDVTAPADPEEGEWGSEMAQWSHDNRDVLTRAGNSEHLDALVEYLVSLGDRGDLKVDAEKAELGATVANDGTLAEGEMETCSGCHTLKGEDDPEFILGTDRFGYPELVDYASAEWLTAFLRDPGTEQFYGLKNHMPAYGPRMSDDELDLLVRWMLRDYPTTHVEPYESKREELEAALKARG